MNVIFGVDSIILTAKLIQEARIHSVCSLHARMAHVFRKYSNEWKLCSQNSYQNPLLTSK